VPERRPRARAAAAPQSPLGLRSLVAAIIRTLNQGAADAEEIAGHKGLLVRSFSVQLSYAVEGYDPEANEPLVAVDSEKLSVLPEYAISKLRIELAQDAALISE
jgi:hypothetical protein